MDLECYRSLYENQNITLALGQKIIKEATLQKRLLDPNILFDNQTKLIHDINKKLTPSLFDNFVPNYKTLATISQLFSLGVTPKNRVVLEQLIVENMSNSNELSDNNADVDSLVVESFVKKFNEIDDDNQLKIIDETFAKMTKDEIAKAKGLRIKVIRFRNGMSYNDLANNSPLGRYAEGKLRLLNGHYPVGKPKVGDLIKIVE